MSTHDDSGHAFERPISRRGVLRAGLGLAATAAALGAPEGLPGPVVRAAIAATTQNQNPVVAWDMAALQAITMAGMAVTPASRALAIVHTCMYDAWTTYDPVAVPTLAAGTPKAVAQGNAGNKARAISYAAYAAAVHLFPAQKSLFDQQMAALGYDPGATSTDTTTPAGVGAVAANAVLARRENDGSNQSTGYVDGTGWPNAYADYPPGYPSTAPNTSTTIHDPNRWQPLRPLGATQDQIFLTPHWGLVTPFALTSGAQFRPAPLAPASYPDPVYTLQARELLALSATLTDTQKMIAEFWRPGIAPTSGNVSLRPASTPPGMWCQIGQFVSQRDRHDVDADVKMFFALCNALFDAGIACWDCKRYYNYVRPITAIHYLATAPAPAGFLNPSTGAAPVGAWGGPVKGRRRSTRAPGSHTSLPPSSPRRSPSSPPGIAALARRARPP